MSDFIQFSQQVHRQYLHLVEHQLFVVDIEPDLLWDRYLAAFPEGSNPIFRERTEHDCSCCRNFIKNLGRVVAILDNRLISVWDDLELAYPYDVVAAQLANLVRNLPIQGVFRTKENRYGAEYNFETIDGQAKKWHHFHGMVHPLHHSATPDRAKGEWATAAAVFRRGLDELTPEAFDTVIGLIQAKNLYRGEEFLPAVLAFQSWQQQYLSMPTYQRELFIWKSAGDPAVRFRNTAIGTLLVDLSAGMELEAAVASFEKKVAPENYKRTSALITPAMIKQALAKLQELNLESAVERRFAKLSDVSIHNVIWADNSAKAVMKDSLLETLLAAPQVKKAKTGTKEAEEIHITDFMTEVVPNAKSMAVLLENRLQSNLVSLTAPVHADVQPLFMWQNNFAWSYNGNLTDSIKEKVKRAGGNTNAQLRVSLAWFNGDDLDIHGITPEGDHIYFANKLNVLDVDMNAGGARNSTDPVENLSWVNPRNGQYRIQVNQYNQRSTSNPGFVLEVENAGKVAQFSYAKPVKGTIECLEFTIKDGLITNLKGHVELQGRGIQQEVWGLQTEQYVPVSTLMFSPNHWDGEATGNKHWFFLLDGCKNPEPTRGLYNEYLRHELIEHRKVFEVLGSQTLCPVVDEQLSGVGFSSTKQDQVQVQVTYSLGDQQTFLVQF